MLVLVYFTSRLKAATGSPASLTQDCENRWAQTDCCREVTRNAIFSGGSSLKPYLEHSDGELQAVLMRILKNKPERHHLLDSETLIAPFSMSEIGG